MIYPPQSKPRVDHVNENSFKPTNFYTCVGQDGTGNFSINFDYLCVSHNGTMHLVNNKGKLAAVTYFSSNKFVMAGTVTY